jgi:RNA-directed DNA polymerase
MASIGQFPARGLIEQWLKAGVVDRGVVAPTEEGVPQGGIISPALMNVALHGMEAAAGVRYRLTGPRAGELAVGSPTLIRYADDLVVLCHSRDEAQQVKERLARWLKPRGLAFNEDKTRIAHLDEGCDFLGFTVRRYHGMLLIKPSKASVRRIRARLTAEVLALRGQNSAAVIAKLNPIIRGWAAYFRGVVSSEVFTSLDDHVWRLVYKWARHTHPNKPNGWVTSRYFGRFNESRQDRWVFGDRESGCYLTKFAWTRIVRHQLVIKGASVDDPALTEYWASRRRRNRPPAQPAPATSAPRTAQPVPALRNPSPARRPAAAEPPRMGAVAAGDPDGGARERAHRRTGRKPVRRSRRLPTHPRSLPPLARRQ